MACGQAIRWTPTEARILRVLADGLPHRPMDLLACLRDNEMGSPATVRVHICNIRRKLPSDQAILYVLTNGPPYYIHVNLRTSGSEHMR